MAGRGVDKILDQRLAVGMNKMREGVEGQSDTKDYLWKNLRSVI